MTKISEPFLESRSAAGFTFIEILVANVILAIIAVGASAMLMQITMQARQNAAVTTLESLRMTMQTSGHAGKMFLNSVGEAGNNNYSKCIFNNGGCPSDTVYPFRLKDVTDTVFVSGDTSTPLYYDIYGEECTAQGAGGNCVFEVLTSFQARCVNNAASCPTAESIHFTYTIRPIPGVDLKASKLISMKPRTGGFWIMVSCITTNTGC